MDRPPPPPLVIASTLAYVAFLGWAAMRAVHRCDWSGWR